MSTDETSVLRGRDARTLVSRIVLFARDYIHEFGAAWSVARHRDCERNGGHRWAEPAIEEPFGLMKVCTRCGTGQTVASVTATTATVWTSAAAAGQKQEPGA
jgi:hypothetical protein